jgi:triphosphatase
MAYSALRQALAGSRYNRFHLSLSRWLACRGWRIELENKSLAGLLEPVPILARRVLTRLHRKTLKQGMHFRHLQPEARHKLRIALKKLRYASEFLRTLRRPCRNQKLYKMSGETAECIGSRQ